MGWARDLAHRVRVDAHAVWLAARDRRTPWYARGWGWLVAAYALSPIDLIPDFVPIIGMVDDVLLVPIGVWLFLRMVPEALFAEHRAAAESASHRPISRVGAVLVVAVWLAIAALIALDVYSWRYY